MAESNNDIMEQWGASTAAKLRDAEISLGIKHNRTDVPAKPRVKFKKKNGEIYKISFSLTKGFIMTNKGVGKYPANRKAKPAWNEVVDVEVKKLADDLAISTGDMLGKMMRL